MKRSRDQPPSPPSPAARPPVIRCHGDNAAYVKESVGGSEKMRKDVDIGRGWWKRTSVVL